MRTDKADTNTVYTKEEANALLDEKQAVLESGANIKTINNQSLVGSGNIDIQGGSGTSDYADLDNKPQINSITLSGNMSATDLGLLTPSDLDDYYTKTETDNGFLSSSIFFAIYLILLG